MVLRRIATEVVAEISALTDGLSDTSRRWFSLLASQIVYRHAGAHTVRTMDHNVVSHLTGRVAVVIGSTRPTRICPDIARWILRNAQDGSPLHYEILDLAKVNLPLLDEPLKAALHEYAHEHTREWSRTVNSYDGFIFVFPQYNWGYPAPLKNAIDYLYAEWRDKPATYATYGTRGGNKAAEQFHQVLQGVHMQQLDDHLELVITDDDVDEDWQLLDVEATLRPYQVQTKAIGGQLVEAIRDTQ